MSGATRCGRSSGLSGADRRLAPRVREAAGLDPLRSEVERLAQARSPNQIPRWQAGSRWAFQLGAEQIAARATDAGMDVIDGIRLTPAEIVEAAKSGVHCIGLSVLSGSHVALTEEVLKLLRAAGLEHVPLVVGGIIPPADAARLEAAGVAAVTIRRRILRSTASSARSSRRSRRALTRRPNPRLRIAPDAQMLRARNTCAQRARSQALERRVGGNCPARAAWVEEGRRCQARQKAPVRAR